MAKSKKLMKGGALLTNPSTYLIVGMLLMSAIVFVCILVVYFNMNTVQEEAPRHKRDHGHHQGHHHEECEASHPQVIHIVTPSSTAKPPIYPNEAPVYPTRGVPLEYQQIGVLVSKDSPEEKPIIMPLFGRKMYSRDRWEYYTASNEYNMWRISVSVNNRDCQDDVGCDEIFNGDNVTVPDYANKVFVAKIYKYTTPSVFAERY